jgi:hypothetical protein
MKGGSSQMGKLHELLAVEPDLDGTHKKVMTEAVNTFAKKANLFMGFVKTLKLYDEEAPEQEPERLNRETTVSEKLDYVAGHFVAYVDAVFQKELANQQAKADIELPNGSVIAKDVPATMLLGLETKLKVLRGMYEAIPTLQPGIEWELNESLGKGVYQTKYPEVSYKTEKTIQHKILDKAHIEKGVGIPAQIEKWNETKNVGKYTKTVFSGMLTSAEKSDILGRLDRLIQATKKARQRANMQDVDDAHIGQQLIDFVNEGIV